MRSPSIRRLTALTFVFLATAVRPTAAADVPGTLDLVEHARFAINALNGTSDDRGEFMFRCSIVPPMSNTTHTAFLRAARNISNRWR